MNKLAILAVAGLGLTIVTVAQPGQANAAMQQCNGNTQLTLNPDGTVSCGGTEIVSGLATSGDGQQVTFELSDTYDANWLAEGEVIEIEITVDGQIAANGVDQQELEAAIAMVEAKMSPEQGLLKGQVQKAGLATSTNAATLEMAYKQSQTARGRSDPAPAGGRSRGDALREAVTRAISRIANFRFNIYRHSYVRERYVNGVMVERTVSEMEIGSTN